MNFYKTMIVVWNNFQRLRGVQQTTKGVLKFEKHEHQKGAIIVTKELVDEFPIKCNKSQFKRLKVNWTLIKEGSNQIKSNQINSNQSDQMWYLWNEIQTAKYTKLLYSNHEDIFFIRLRDSLYLTFTCKVIFCQMSSVNLRSEISCQIAEAEIFRDTFN